MYVAILKDGNKIELWGVRHVECGNKGDLWIYLNGDVYHVKNASIVDVFVTLKNVDKSMLELNSKSTLESLEA